MKLDADYGTLLDQMKPRLWSARQIISLMDLTLLDESASESALTGLLDKSRQYPVAAICVYPQHLPYFPANQGYRRATVVNFPGGNQDISTVLHAIERIIESKQAEEIDYVFPWSLWLQGRQPEAIEHCRAAYMMAQQGNMLFKVIMETGAFPSADSVYELSRELIQIGCDFLKTSTGKIATGATPLAAYSMLRAIQDEGSRHCGIKLSGGIRTAEQAHLYMNMACEVLRQEPDKSWFRLGASTLLDELVTDPDNQPG
ncbi:2-deoxyribose-5-phosphate aldolase [Legionella sp. CNM-4043-24]|uniref:2-deoxyribose-5-phosphate aldolase n=1 Tax=Legionella sp. CNM-4043-24 TaxID=3421646 RepID=UPI00403A8513